MLNMSATTGLAKTSSTFVDLPSKAESIAWTSVYGIEALLIVIGNSVTVVLSGVNTKLRKKGLLLIINMAFADLLYGAAMMPFKIYSMYVGHYYQLLGGNHSFSAALEFSYAMTFVFLLNSSLMSAALISCERFYAVYYPLKHRTLSNRAYHVAIFVKWVLALVISITGSVLLSLVSRKIALYILKSCFMTILLMVCGGNIGIWRTFRQRRIASEQPNRALQNQRLTKTLLFVSFIALMSWLPVITIHFLIVANEVSISSRIYHVAVVLNVTNCLLNPLIYTFRIPEFRRTLGFSCFRKQVPTTGKDHKRKENFANCNVPSKAHVIASGTDSSHQELPTGGCETKL